MKNRGFHFLIGLATLWLTWRLYQSGVLHDCGFLMSGVPVSKGPGAVLVSFAIEFVIAVGAVATLVITGLWDAIVTIGGLLQDVLRGGRTYLLSVARERQAVAREKNPPEKKPPTEREALLLTLKAQREELDELQREMSALRGDKQELPTEKAKQ